MAYEALISVVGMTLPIAGCDNIQLATVCGYQVIVGKDVKPGDVGIFFEAGGQLSLRFATANDLISRKDASGQRAGGYFDHNRRVRAIKMKGVCSEGFFCGLSSLLAMFAEPDVDREKARAALLELKPGDALDTFVGVPICNRFETSATQRWAKEQKRSARRETKMFRAHSDTEPLKKMLLGLPDQGVVYVTEKLHGTSARYGRVIDDIPVTGLRRLWRRLMCKPLTDPTWVKIGGTRNVILKYRKDGGFLGREVFRETVFDAFKDRLEKGEVLYGEIVGFTEDGASIMSAQDGAKLRDPAFRDQYRSPVVYRYGCGQAGSYSECEFHVYRITQVNEDGYVVELPWQRVKTRAAELGLRAVPELARFLYGPDCSIRDPEGLLNLVMAHVEPGEGRPPLSSTLDETHPREGVCVRIESKMGTKIYKVKSSAFSILEGFLKDDRDYVDREEAA